MQCNTHSYSSIAMKEERESEITLAEPPLVQHSDCTLSAGPTLIFWFISDKRESLPRVPGDRSAGHLQFFINTITAASRRGEEGGTCVARTPSLTPIKNCQDWARSSYTRHLIEWWLMTRVPTLDIISFANLVAQQQKCPALRALVPVRYWISITFNGP